MLEHFSQFEKKIQNFIKITNLQNIFKLISKNIIFYFYKFNFFTKIFLTKLLKSFLLIFDRFLKNLFILLSCNRNKSFNYIKIFFNKNSLNK
jgi:hypothetical protein